jgi:uncharacterized membrane protein SpoIIM required for sporulation
MRDNRTLLILSFSTYAIGIVVGIIHPGGQSGAQDLSTKGLQVDQIALFAGILSTNLKMELTITVLGGIICFGVLAALILLFNGFVLGSAIRLSAQYNWILPLYSLAPHGILEVVAIVLAGFVAMRIPGLVIHYLHGDIERSHLRDSAISLSKVSILVILITFIAAIIEAFFTPYLLRLTGWW